MTDEEAALKKARGVYQRALIMGEQNWSGSDLGAEARSYAKHYTKSRKALLERLMAAELAYLVKCAKGRLELRFGVPPPWYRRTQCASGICFTEGEPSLLEQIAFAAKEDS